MKVKSTENIFTTQKPVILAFHEIPKDTQVKQPDSGTFAAPTYSLDDAINHVGYGRFQLRLMFLAGLGWAADAAEVIILSLIGQFLACHWEITTWQNALLTSVAFGGMMIGSPVFGTMADRFGRRKSLGVSLTLLFIFGAVSAASPSFPWMATFRGLTGFALSGIPQGLTLCSEYFPTNLRGRAGLYLCYFWSFGTVGVILMAWGIMTATDSWRTLLAVTSVPALLSVLSIKCYPESARYYLVSNKYKDALKVIKDMASTNKKELPPGQLMPIAECSQRGRITDLLGSGYRRSTLLFWYMWLASAFCYYGIALMSPIIIQTGSITNIGTRSISNMDLNRMSEELPCVKFTDQNFIDLLWTSAAEFPGILVFTFLVECCQRKVLMFAACLMSSIFVFLLLLPVTKIVILLFLFAARGLISAIFQLTFIMTAEAFPTTMRAVAMGAGGSFCRLGGLIAPYVSQVLFVANPVAAVCVLGAVILLSGLAAMLLPLETRGRVLEESHLTDS